MMVSQAEAKTITDKVLSLSKADSCVASLRGLNRRHVRFALNSITTDGEQDDLTLTGLTWRGDHTVKTGVKFKRVTLTAADAENINPQFFYSVDQTGTATTPWKAQFTDPVPGLNAVAESRNTQFGLYIQDDWLPTQKLTLNIGVRWDYERTPSYLDHVTPANVLAALNSPHPAAQATFPGQTYAQTLAKGGININDYISNGNNRSPIKDEIQPRFGVAYDLNADQQHVVFGGAGRAYDRDLYDYLQLEETKQALPTLEVNFNVTDPLGGAHPCNPRLRRSASTGIPSISTDCRICSRW